MMFAKIASLIFFHNVLTLLTNVYPQTVNFSNSYTFDSFSEINLPLYQNSEGNGALLILQNSLYPIATLSSTGDLICSGLFWSHPFTPTAQKINQNGAKIWTGDPYGFPLAQFDPNSGDEALETTPRLILPDEEGGAYFAFSYSEFAGRQQTVKLYRSYPHLQKVSIAGDTLWGVKGIRLTNRSIGEHGGGEIISLDYSPAGEILIGWSWFSIDTLGQREFGTYIQKVDANTGALKMGSNGKKILNATSAVRKGGSRLYFFYEDSVLCINKTGDKIWNLDLLAGIGSQTRKIYAANDSGEVLVLYEDANGIKGRLFDEKGAFIWRDLRVLEGNFELFFNTPLVSWGSDKWLFKSGGTIHSIDRTGSKLWGDSGLSFPDSGLIGQFGPTGQFAPIDSNSFYCLATSRRNSAQDLLLCKIDQKGKFLWGDSGVLIFEKVNPTFTPLLVDQAGDAFIVVDGEVLYEPVYRPRGTFVQKVDKDGNLGIITSIKPDYGKIEKKTALRTFAYPNPFNTGTNIFVQGLELSEHSDVTIRIFNLLGKEVNSYALKSPRNKELIIQWDGKNKIGEFVANGQYFYRVSIRGNIIASGKILMRR